MKIKWTKKKILLLIFSISAILYIFFYHIGVYTSSAYFRANWVEISPRVEGHVDEVFVRNNKFVKKGEVLFKLYAYPYELKLNKLRAEYSEAEGASLSIKDNIKAVALEINDSKNQLELYGAQKKRFNYLRSVNAESQQSLENIELNYQEMSKEHNDLKGQYAVLQDNYKTKLKTLKRITAEMKLAQYHLDQTTVTAPIDGYITNNYLMRGQYIHAGVPVFGIAQTQECWIEANYKENFIGKIKPGQKVWFTTDLYPFRILTGTVLNTTNAVNRTPTPDKLLPYIKPTIDWVRLQYRFTVRIKIDKIPKDMHLRMGADARVLTWL
jgi:membrane fusion protein, multidrug efflux system